VQKLSSVGKFHGAINMRRHTCDRFCIRLTIAAAKFLDRRVIE
jgi:hypothetical protein